MRRTGHYGAALVLYAPLGFALAASGRPDLALIGGAVTLALAPLPDYDLRVPLLTHRGATHTVLFAVLVGVALGGAGRFLGGLGGNPETIVAPVGFAVGLLAIGSHLLADALTPAGITPFWPVFSRTYSLNVARADNPLANYGLLALGVFLTAALFVLARRFP